MIEKEIDFEVINDIMFDEPFNRVIISPKQAVEEINRCVDLQVFCRKVNELNVNTITDAKSSVEMISQLRKMKATIDKSKKEVLSPYQEFYKAVSKCADDLHETINSVKEILKTKLSEFSHSEFYKTGVMIQKIDTEEGSMTQSKKWIYMLEDETQIPKQYMSIDESKIKASIKAGIREIPGVSIFEVDEISFRVKNT